MHPNSTSRNKSEHLAQQVAAVSGVDPFSLGNATDEQLAELTSAMLQVQMGMFHPDRGRGAEDSRLFHDAAEARAIADELGVSHCFQALQRVEAGNLEFRQQAEAETEFFERASTRLAREMLRSAREASHSRELGASFAGYDIEFEDLVPRAREASRIVAGDLDGERYRHWVQDDRQRFTEVLDVFKVALAEPDRWRDFCRREDIQKCAIAAVGGPHSSEIRRALSDERNITAAVWFRNRHVRYKDDWDDTLDLYDTKFDLAFGGLGPVVVRQDFRHPIYSRAAALAFCRPKTLGNQVCDVVASLMFAAHEQESTYATTVLEDERRMLSVEYGIACGDPVLFAAVRENFFVALQQHHKELHTKDILPWQFSASTLKRFLSRDEIRATRRVTSAYDGGEEIFLNAAKREDRRRNLITVLSSGSDEAMKAMLDGSIAERISVLSDQSGVWVSTACGGARQRIYPIGIFTAAEEQSPGFGGHFREDNPGTTVLGIDTTRDPTRPFRRVENERESPIRYIDIEKPLDKRAAALVVPRLVRPPSLDIDDFENIRFLVGVVETDTSREVRIIGRVLRIEKRQPNSAVATEE